jgi:Peptidase family C25
VLELKSVQSFRWVVLAAVAATFVLAPSVAQAAVVQSVQTGIATSNADGVMTVPIPVAINPTQSALFFDSSHDSNRPTSSAVAGRIASATTLEFVRATDETPPGTMEIRWYVVQWSSGVSVQRGVQAQNGTVIDIPITAVAGVNQAFVTWSKFPQPTDINNLDNDDPIIGELTNTTNLQFRVNMPRPVNIYWQVIEFTNAADINVQKGSTALFGNAALSVDVTLPIAVDPASTFVLVGYQTTSGAGPAIGARMLRAQLIDATTVRIDRSIGDVGADITEIHWQAVELRDGSEVLRGSASFANGVATAVAGFGGRKLNLNGAVAFASVQVESGLNMGKTPFATDDIVGVCSVRSTLAPTTLTLTRANTGDTCDVGWFAVQFAPTAITAVTLQSFTATGGDGEVLLQWETGSELNNLGFHLYRSASEAGPWQRITSSLIPGLGSSPDGAQYAYHDTGLANGSTWYYLLEDVETTGKTKRHGPVSATPQAGVAAAPAADPAAPPVPAPVEQARTWLRFGQPEATSLIVVERQAGGAVIELQTGGFYALPDEDGSVFLSIPGFEETRLSGAPTLPVKLAWLEAVAGRKVQIVSMVGQDVVAFTSLRPSVVGEAAMFADANGTVSPRMRRRQAGIAFRAAGLYPEEPARLVETAFQGQVKKAEIELSPLRWDRANGQLLLARKLRVRVAFAGQEPGEVSRGGSRGLAALGGRNAGGKPKNGDATRVVARLTVRERGLQAVSYEQIFGPRGRVALTDLRLSRQGVTVAHHVEPDRRAFAPGSVLFFVSEGPVVNPHGNELVYELSLAGSGTAMPVASAAPSGAALAEAWTDERWEKDVQYLPGLLQAESPWLWDTLLATWIRSYPMELGRVAPTSEPARLSVWLQGGTDFLESPDHHVRIRVNGNAVGEASWDGQTPYRLDADLAPGTLVEGANLFEIENVGDTTAQYSQVFLDRYELRSARQLVAQAGSLDGVFHAAGSAEIRELPLGTMVLDTTEPVARWLVDTRASSLGVSFRAEAGRRYLAVSPQAVKSVVAKPAGPSVLRGALRADYLVVGPREFLAAAEPLLEQRRGQGLESMSVAIEDVYDEFGYGEAHPGAVKAFLEYAFHSWERAPRYVVLLGDATYDFKNSLGTGTLNRVPPIIIRDTYLWTVSDPEYAFVNGSDLLPDVALGRLPAANVAEAERLVHKLLDWENLGFDLSGRTVLVADNADAAGDFESDSDRLAQTFLADRSVERIYLSQLGSGTRAAITQAFDTGASLMTYIGHGGTAVWASENIWNFSDVARLAPQAQQPFLMTMDCLNGFFHHPRMNSLSEELLKADGKGAVGTLAPSSLSVHWAADVYLEALTRELVSGRHQRLGDALLAAQAAYIEAGARPELLRTYQLLADPALPITHASGGTR